MSLPALDVFSSTWIELRNHLLKKIEAEVKLLETTKDPIEIYTIQGSIKALRYMVGLEEKLLQKRNSQA